MESLTTRGQRERSLKTAIEDNYKSIRESFQRLVVSFDAGAVGNYTWTNVCGCVCVVLGVDRRCEVERKIRCKR